MEQTDRQKIENLHLRVPFGTGKRIDRVIQGEGISRAEWIRRILFRVVSRYETKNRVICEECKRIPCKCGMSLKPYYVLKNT